MVPEGWKIKSLKDILSGSIRNGFSPISSDKETGFWALVLLVMKGSMLLK